MCGFLFLLLAASALCRPIVNLQYQIMGCEPCIKKERGVREACMIIQPSIYAVIFWNKQIKTSVEENTIL